MALVSKIMGGNSEMNLGPQMMMSSYLQADQYGRVKIHVKAYPTNLLFEPIKN